MAVQTFESVSKPVYPPRRRTPRAVRRARTLALLFILLLSALIFFFPRAVHTQGRGEAIHGVEYTVLAGDTLWEIAAQYAGRRDIREVIHRIEQANGLDSATIQPGQTLFIPTPPGSLVVGR